MASGGVGSAHHVYGELFKMMTGVDMLHVPYRGGGPALTDLLAGQVPVMFDTLATSIERIRAAGKGVGAPRNTRGVPKERVLNCLDLRRFMVHLAQRSSKGGPRNGSRPVCHVARSSSR
jgi:tripartite tricarboxylate transporter family receptor